MAFVGHYAGSHQHNYSGSQQFSGNQPHGGSQLYSGSQASQQYAGGQQYAREPLYESDDSTIYQDYWQELEQIKQSNDPEADNGSEDELDSKTPDEAEEAADWLQNTGFGELVSQVLEGREVDDYVIESHGSLTKAQSDALKRRISTLRSTLHKKKNKSKTDVRDVFQQAEAPPSPTTDGIRNPADRGSYMLEPPQPSALHPPSSPSQKLPRNISILRRKEYNMDGDRLQPIEAGVEMLRIQAKPSSNRLGNTGSEDSLQSPHLHISLPVSDADFHVQMRKSQSPHSSSSGAPQSPLSFPSSSSSWRGSVVLLDGLPPMRVQPDNLGITRITDLGSADADKLRPLLLLELTTLFDHHHITYIRRKPKKKFKDSGVFGVPLQTLVEQDRKIFKNTQNLTVSVFFQELITFLTKDGIKEEGILRVPGSVLRIKALCTEIDEKFYSGSFDWSDVRPNDAAGLLKQFLRELPAPILTFDYLEAFAQVDKISGLQDQIMALKLLVLLLPETNRNTLQVLLRFLKRVVDHQENLMTMNNVAMIMAPNLFLMPQGRQSKSIKFSELQMAAGTSNIIRMLIFYQHLLWIVPTTMIQQMRHQNEAELLRKSRDKSIMKILGRKDKPECYKRPPINNETDYRNGLIRVQVPSMKKFTTAIQLESDTSAGDIVTRCIYDVAGPRTPANKATTDPFIRPNNNGRRDSSGDDLELDDPDNSMSSLYEVGGNIGERRLDSSTKVLEVLKYNPNAEWVIRRNTPIY